VLAAVTLDQHGQGQDSEACADDGHPDYNSSEIINHNTVQHCHDQAGSERVIVDVLGLLQALSVFLNVIKAEVSNQVVVGVEVDARR